MKSGQSLVTQLYFTTSDKYRKLKSRIDKSILSGRFKKLTQRKRGTLLAKLKRLYKRLKDLQMQLKLAGATVALSLITSFGAEAQTLGPFNLNDAANPLPAPHNISYPRVAVVDIDGDGDLDVFVGNYNGDIQFFRNDNGPGLHEKVKRFTEVTGSGNPFDGVNKGQHAAPAFADVDGDGDYDMMLGIGGGPNIGTTYFFRNSSATSPVFTEQTGVNNPFDGITGPSSKYSNGPAVPVFVDIDGDTDLDLFISGTYSYDYYGTNPAANYFENNSGVFTPASHNLTSYLADNSFYRTAMTFADLDLNGELDVIFSDGNGELRCFVEASSEYPEEFGPWNPITRTGNPMYGFYLPSGSPVFADFDGDGDLDLIVGQSNSYRASVQYFENTDGAFSFAAKNGLNISPMGGVDVGQGASEQFVDLDNDGDLDAILGAKYNNGSIPNIFVYIRDEEGDFVESPDHPLVSAFPTYFNDLIPVFADIDDDGDPDMLVSLGNTILFHRNNDGTFEAEPTLFPSFNYSNARRLSPAFIDVDNDGDLDALIGNSESSPPIVQYFENQANPTIPGQIQVPEFVEATPPAPFNSLLFGYNASPNLIAVDLDNDGDTDIILSEGYYFDSGSPGYRVIFRFFENKGDGTFTEGVTPINDVLDKNSYDTTPYLNFADLDGDGDLDGFVGNSYGSKDGQITYYENSNPPPTPTPSISQFNYNFGNGAVVIDGNFTISDSDNDQIVKAIISIQNFQSGEEVLSFTLQGGVGGQFDNLTGILTLTGLAPLTTYQSIIRSVAYEFIGSKPNSGGRKSIAGRTVISTKGLFIQVFDEDLTAPSLVAIAMSVTFPNVLPQLTSSPTPATYTGSPIIIDGSVAVTDFDDADLASATVQINPSTFVAGQDVLLFTNQLGMTGSYNNTTGVLSLNGIASTSNYQTALRSIRYQNISSTPTTTNRTVEFVVNDGEALSNIISNSIAVTIPNKPPVITPNQLVTVIKGLVTLNLLSIVTDSDGNLDQNTFAIVQLPVSGAFASIDIPTSVLSIDYFNTSFAGLDNMIIEVFDTDGARAEATITIQVEGDIIVRNGMSPNGDGLNDYFRLDNITTLGAQNKVSIFTRWGDKVFEIDDYDNQNRRFDGKSDSGKELASGVYFYKIVFSNGQPEQKGYLTLKR